jgi:hypothetical protein
MEKKDQENNTMISLSNLCLLGYQAYRLLENFFLNREVGLAAFSSFADLRTDTSGCKLLLSNKPSANFSRQIHRVDSEFYYPTSNSIARYAFLRVPIDPFIRIEIQAALLMPNSRTA